MANVSREVRLRHSTDEAGNDRGGKGVAERNRDLMTKLEPHPEVGNPAGRRTSEGIDPASKRAQIAAKARSNPKERFNNLLHHLTPALIEECLNEIPKSSAAGVSGMTVKQTKENLSWLLPPILKSIHEGRYEAPPVRRVYIPKADGTQRPLGVPEVIDRAIQAAMTKILNEIYEQDFMIYSFGFRPGLGCHHALATVSRQVGQMKMNHVLEVDLRDFFGSLSHEWLGKFLEYRIGDRRVLALIRSWLKAGVVEKGQWRGAENGTPQGGSISPLLANIYLHYVLDLWFDKKIKPRMKRAGHLIRYCDDFVFLFQSEEDVKSMRALLVSRLSQFGLTVHEEKTHFTDLTPGKPGGGNRRKMSFLGFSIFQTRNRQGWGWKTVFRTDGRRFTRAKMQMKERLHKIMHWEIQNQVSVINSLLRGHFNYYGLPGNSRRLSEFWNLVGHQWRRKLSRRSQRGSLKWEEVVELRKKYPWVLPKLKIRYCDLNAYVRL